MKHMLSKATLKKRSLYLFDKLLDLIYAALGCALLWLVWQVFFYSSFLVPTPSMEPEIMPGDRVVVWKPWMGARLFNFFAALGGEEPPVYRMPGLRSPQRGAILVFNYPYSDGWDKITFSVKTYYVKRCIALPGDTLRIREGIYRIAGYDATVGNLESQRALAAQSDSILKARHHWRTYPRDTLLGWNVKNFGPLKIPAIGDEIILNRANYVLYGPLIEWETKKTIHFKPAENICYLGKRPLATYRFRQNYYFMAGDQAENSEDSRYWGLVPEDFIVGRIGWISQSHDPSTGRLRRERWMKRIK